MKENYITKLESSFKDYLWGGSKIRDTLHKNIGEMERVAESWEVSSHPDGESIIAEGEYAGKTLTQYFDTVGWNIFGEYGLKNRRLPILVKYIDAKDNLSIQVHPTDDYAREHAHDSGKNEMWIVLSAEKNAFVYLGFNRDVTAGEIRERIKSGTLEEVLNKLPVKKGQVIYIPAGTVHAIGKGCLVCEIQQTSNITYRLYDYGRLDKFGKKRELHIENALEVLNFSKFETGKYVLRDVKRMGTILHEMLTDNDNCNVIMYRGDGELNCSSNRNAVYFAVIYSGKGTLTCEGNTVNVHSGDTYMLTGRTVNVLGKCKLILLKL